MINKLYDKIFKSKHSKGDDIFWEKFYNKKIDIFKKYNMTDLDDWREKRYYKQLIEILKRKLGINSFANLRILELGSGSGLLSILMAQEGADVTLVDKSEKAIEYENILLNQVKIQSSFMGRIEIIKQDMFFLKLPYYNFDIVHNYGVTEHFSRDKALKMVKIMTSFIKRGGTVIVGVPNYFCPDLIFLWKKHGKGTEVFYNKAKLRNFLKGAGLKEVRVFNSSSVFLFFPKFLVQRIGFLEKILGEKFGLGFLFIGIGKKY